MASFKVVNINASEIKGQIVISKIIFDISTSKENDSQENYVTSDDGQELDKFKIEQWKLYLTKKLEANKTFISQTDNLNISYSFEFGDHEACKKLLSFDDADDTKVINDHVLSITYTRKLKKISKREKFAVADELKETENKNKKKPLQPRNKCDVEMNSGQTKVDEKASQRKRSAEKKTEIPNKGTSDNPDVPENKKAKASKPDTKNKKTLTLSLRSHKQPTIHQFFQTSPPGVKSEEKLTAVVPNADKQSMKSDKASKRKKGKGTMQNDFIPLEKAVGKNHSPVKPETDVLCYPVTPKKEVPSAIANLQNITKNMRTPVKSSTVFPNYDPKEDVGLEEFAIPVDAEYEADCAALKEAFGCGLVEEVDSNIARRMFQRNLPFLEAIQSGKIYSIRHEEYHSDIQKRRTMDYAPGCIIFGDKNLGLFMEMMGDILTIDNDDHRDKIPYFMLVLVPELITKIVMGVFNINKQDAVKKKKDIGILVTKNTPNLF